MARRTETQSEGREAQAAEVLAEVLPAGAAAGPLLVVDDVDGHLDRVVPQAVRWSRVVHGARGAAAWPPAGPHPGATLRLPKSKPAFELALHAAASTLPPGAPLWLYGANDEGIRSVGDRLGVLFDAVETIAVKRRCRVWQGTRNTTPARAPLAAWRHEATMALPDGPVAWVEYPGVFAAGRLDPATAVLLDVLAPFEPGARVLDFGCGAGAIAATVARRVPTARLHLVDVDAVALEAARENVPGATLHLGDGWAACPDLVVDRIVSNPPIHRGKHEDYTALVALIDAAPRHLARGGRLELVVQRRLPVQSRLEAAFKRVELAHEDPRWHVWRAS